VLAGEVLFDVADAGEGDAEAAAVEGGVGFPEGAGECFLLGDGEIFGAFGR
jgi:hypothetical protein